MAQQRMPIARKLTRMNMLVSTSALLTACVAFAVYDVMTFRDVLVRNLSIQAQMVASTSVSALVFNDEDIAAETLAALDAAPDVLSAEILTADGKPFATYRRGSATAGRDIPSIPAGQLEAVDFDPDEVTLSRRVIFDGKPAGTVAIRSTLQSLYARLRNYALLAGSVLIVSAVAALLASRLMRDAISNPIVSVAALAHRVAQGTDYSERAIASDGASLEVASFMTSFNDMLDRVQQRDRELAEARGQLEERVRLRTEELAVAYRDLEGFSYSVSHDLRAPLRHVTGFAALLTQHLGNSLDERGRRYLDTLTGSAKRMGDLIDDLLAFSRMGRASLSPRRVDLAQMVQEVQAELATDTADRQIEWDVHRLPTVYADPALLRPVVTNLLSNAVKYTSTRPVAQIEIGSSRSESGDVVVFVRDNGVGFDMAYAHKLFGVFQRLHRSDEFSGSGIGLANVRRIIQRHGGKTWAHAEVDKGATFFFSLPEPTP
jgi:signal transduction histidine kinase